LKVIGNPTREVSNGLRGRQVAALRGKKRKATVERSKEVSAGEGIK